MRRPSSLVLALVLLAVVVVALDQGTKAWALSALTEGERTPLLGDLLGLTLVFNPGAALGIATGMTWVLTLAAIAVTVIVLKVSSRLGSRTWTVALGLLLGGAVGNLVDRLFREPGIARGLVVDFIAYGDWFVGNVADIAIVAAAGLMILLGMRGIALDGTRHVDGPAPQGTTGGSFDAGAPQGAPADGGIADRTTPDGESAGDELAGQR